MDMLFVYSEDFKRRDTCSAFCSPDHWGATFFASRTIVIKKLLGIFKNVLNHKEKNLRTWKNDNLPNIFYSLVWHLYFVGKCGELKLTLSFSHNFEVSWKDEAVFLPFSFYITRWPRLLIIGLDYCGQSTQFWSSFSLSFLFLNCSVWVQFLFSEGKFALYKNPFLPLQSS